MQYVTDTRRNKSFIELGSSDIEQKDMIIRVLIFDSMVRCWSMWLVRLASLSSTFLWLALSALPSYLFF